MSFEQKRKIVIVYPGRFQPPHIGHAAVYRSLVDNFGKDYVYVATSNVTDPVTSPLSFEWRQKLISQLFSIPTSKIIRVKSSYSYEDYLKRFSKKEGELKVIFAVGEKDAERLSPSYFTKIKSFDKEAILKSPKNKNLYYYIIPNVKLDGKVISATDIRAIIRKRQLSSSDFKKIETLSGMKRQQVLTLKPLFEESYLLQLQMLFEMTGKIPVSYFKK